MFINEHSYRKQRESAKISVQPALNFTRTGDCNKRDMLSIANVMNQI